MQCWTQASKPEPLKQDTQKGKDNRKKKTYIQHFKINLDTYKNII